MKPIIDVNRPTFHIMPIRGWINDPNGPIVHRGLSHIYFQHVSDAPNWDWGISWGHAVSKNLVHWKREPLALTPKPRGPDTSGCWSGSVTLNNADAAAVYTGVRLKGAAYDGPQTRDYAPGEPMIETVLISRCQDSDGSLSKFEHGKVLIAEPPDLPGVTLEGWRDPFIYRRGDATNKWMMLLGSGYKRDGAKNGCVMLYTAESLDGPWAYEGIIAEGDRTLGRVWECPLMVQLVPGDEQNGASHLRDFHITHSDEDGHSGRHLLVVGAYQSTEQNAAWEWDPVMYMLGDFNGRNFDSSTLPHRFDLGEAPYAPNVVIDGQGRVIVWIWLRDVLPEGLVPPNYLGCLGVPRLVTLVSGRAHQQPLPELAELRGTQLWTIAASAAASCVGILPLDGLQGNHLDAHLTLTRNDAEQSGILLFAPDSKFDALLLLVDWTRSTLTGWKAPASDLLRLSNAESPPHSVSCTMQGPLMPPSADGSDDGELSCLQLRVLVDGSVVEVFTSTGQALSTRLHWDENDTCLFNAASFGGRTTVYGQAWEMTSIWRPDDLVA